MRSSYYGKVESSVPDRQTGRMSEQEMLRRVKRRKVEEAHVSRSRRSCRGELVQWNTSEHDWLEGRGPKLYLVAMIDEVKRQVEISPPVTSMARLSCLLKGFISLQNFQPP
jgi:hypothetical protein